MFKLAFYTQLNSAIKYLMSKHQFLACVLVIVFDQVYICFPNLLIKAAYWQKVVLLHREKNSDVNSCSQNISVMYAK